MSSAILTLGNEEKNQSQAALLQESCRDDLTQQSLENSFVSSREIDVLAGMISYQGFTTKNASFWGIDRELLAESRSVTAHKQPCTQ